MKSFPSLDRNAYKITNKYAMNTALLMNAINFIGSKKIFLIRMNGYRRNEQHIFVVQNLSPTLIHFYMMLLERKKTPKLLNYSIWPCVSFKVKISTETPTTTVVMSLFSLLSIQSVVWKHKNANVSHTYLPD